MKLKFDVLKDSEDLKLQHLEHDKRELLGDYNGGGIRAILKTVAWRWPFNFFIPLFWIKKEFY